MLLLTLYTHSFLNISLKYKVLWNKCGVFIPQNFIYAKHLILPANTELVFPERGGIDRRPFVLRGNTQQLFRGKFLEGKESSYQFNIRT